MKQADLQGKWALVTGASSGLGVGFAKNLASRGHHLILVAGQRWVDETTVPHAQPQPSICLTASAGETLAEMTDMNPAKYLSIMRQLVITMGLIKPCVRYDRRLCCR